jgi:hypothetical protein
MKNILKVVAVAAVAVALTQSVQAVPITGVIGFSGSSVLDGSTASGSSEVLSWGPSIISLNSGTFASLDPSSTVAFASPWFFDSSSLNNFWVVNDTVNNVTYKFNLSSSSVFSTSANSITIYLAGTVISTALGLDPTAFTGNMTIQDPGVKGQVGYKYSESISFNSVPDGGTTALLLGSALSGLALLRRKLSA